MDKNIAIKIASRKQVVTNEGEYIIKVKNTAKSGKASIINTNLCTKQQLKVFAEAFLNGEPNAQYELNKCQLSYFVKLQGEEFFPQKGDFIVVVVEKIPTKKGTSSDFRITGYKKLTKQNAEPAEELLEGLLPNKVTPADMARADDEQLGVINNSVDIDMPYNV